VRTVHGRAGEPSRVVGADVHPVQNPVLDLGLDSWRRRPVADRVPGSRVYRVQDLRTPARARRRRWWRRPEAPGWPPGTGADRSLCIVARYPVGPVHAAPGRSQATASVQAHPARGREARTAAPPQRARHTAEIAAGRGVARAQASPRPGWAVRAAAGRAAPACSETGSRRGAAVVDRIEQPGTAGAFPRQRRVAGEPASAGPRRAVPTADHRAARAAPDATVTASEPASAVDGWPTAEVPG